MMLKVSRRRVRRSKEYANKFILGIKEIVIEATIKHGAQVLLENKS